LFRYCEGVIDLDAEISNRAFDLGMPVQTSLTCHSITSSARARIDVGITRPIAFAAFRLIASWNRLA
jgi:hypothetical protein